MNAAGIKLLMASSLDAGEERNVTVILQFA